MSQEEIIIIKNYKLLSGDYEFCFIGNIPRDFSVQDISTLSQGFEDETFDDTAVYPSNIEITVDDYDETGSLYNFFLWVLANYKNTFPFDYENVFYLLIKRNNEEFFKGYLEDMERDLKARQIKLRFTDGINKLKNVSFGNPRLLDFLFQQGVISRTDIILGYAIGSNEPLYLGYQYGFNTNWQRRHIGDPSQGTFSFSPGSVMDEPPVKLVTFIRALFKSLDPDISAALDMQMKFCDKAENKIVDAESVYIRNVLSNFLGRYLVFLKFPVDPNFGIKEIRNINNGDFMKFEKVFEDERYIVYYHNYRGPAPDINLNFHSYNRGFGSIKVSEALRYLANNFFSYFAFNGPKKIIWRHKKTANTFMPLERINDLIVSSDVPKIEQVKVKDSANGIEGVTGNLNLNTNLTEMQSVELTIPFTAKDFPYDEKHFLFFYDYENETGDETPVAKLKDLQFTGAGGNTGYIQEQISKSEYYKQFISIQPDERRNSRFEINAEGIDFDFSETYKFLFRDYDVFIKPLMMEKNLQENTTKITGVRIK